MTGWKILMIKEIEDYLDSLFPNPKCELNYNKDYELVIAVMLSARATDKMVNSVTGVLFEKYNFLELLVSSDIENIKRIIKRVGTYNKKAMFVKEIASELLTKYDGVVPNDRKALESLPGVGRKCANVILSNLFDYPAIAVDTHVSRVSKRLGLAKENDDALKIEKKLMKKFDKSVWSRRHHQMVLFGRYYCKSINPSCDGCKLKHICNNSK